MPKGFTEREKVIIRGKLVESGKESFKTFGVRRTNVEDLTRAAGISKGAFYQFFDSKEDLWLAIMEQYEQSFREMFFCERYDGSIPARQYVKETLARAFEAWKRHPLFASFKREELDYLLRKLPPEKIQNHLSSDTRFLTELVEQWKQEGIQVRETPEVITGLTTALFFVSFHEQEIGEQYQGTMDLLLTMIVEHIISE
jgi:AcrR family transcriptional regulator